MGYVESNLETGFSKSLRPFKKESSAGSVPFCVLFSAEHFVAADFLKKGVGGSVFLSKQVYFPLAFFGLLLMKKEDWFRWMVFMVFSHGNAFIFAREFEKFLSIEMFSEGCFGSEKWVGGSFSVFQVKFSNLFLNYFSGGKPVFARVTRFFEEK